jgi:hypothetical protein
VEEALSRVLGDGQAIVSRGAGAVIGRATVLGRIAGAAPRRGSRAEPPGRLLATAIQAHPDGVAVRVVGELRREGRGDGLCAVQEVLPDEGAGDA